MEWTLRLAGMGIDGDSRSFGVMAISRPDGLGDIANLVLTLAESKLLLAQVQQHLVAGQANTPPAFRPDCRTNCKPGCPRVAADVRQHLLPIDAGTSPETLRSHTLAVGKQLADAHACL